MSDSPHRTDGLIPPEARSSLAKDAFGPAAKNFGQEIAPLGKEAGVLVLRSGKIALKLAEGVVWGVERISDFIEEEISRRLENVPDHQLTEPSPRILLPAMQALVYTGTEEGIRELFAALIASDMNSATKSSVHPSFVEIIKEMTTDEAALLKYLAEHGPQMRGEYRVYSDPANQRAFLTSHRFHTTECGTLDFDECEVGFSNLNRLGLISFENGIHPASDVLRAYEQDIENSDFIKGLRGNTENIRVVLHKTGIYVTPLGERFIGMCLQASS